MFVFIALTPFDAVFTLFIQPTSDISFISEVFVTGTPVVIIAVGLAMWFRATVWNIGAEGQLTMGAIFGGGLALYFYDSESMFLLPGMLVLGALGGAFWGAIPALLRTRFNANEILTSLMLTYVATLFLSFLVHGPWRNPEGFNFPESRPFPDAGLLPVIYDGTRVHLGTALAVFVVIAGWLLLSKSVIGFPLRVVGKAPQSARHVGFRQELMVWFTLLLGGCLVGLAGLFEVAGPIGQLQPSISPGYGFTAIIVAFLGRLHPVGILFGGLIMALTYLGGELAQITLGLPNAVTGLFQGILLFFLLACAVLRKYRLRFGSTAANGRTA